jgi:hypothetical protein
VIVSDDSYHGNFERGRHGVHVHVPEGEQPAWLATVPPPNGYRGEYRYGTPDLGRKYAAHIDPAIAKLQERKQGAAAWVCDIIFDSTARSSRRPAISNTPRARSGPPAALHRRRGAVGVLPHRG